jgi:hypothetical protein
MENKMEKQTITTEYLRGLIREEKNEVTKAWMMTSLDLGTEKNVWFIKISQNILTGELKWKRKWNMNGILIGNRL